MDLFKVRLPKDKLDKSFRQIVTDPAYAPVRDVIQSWGKGLLERSGEQIKFVNEFQSTFNSAFWELYLNKLFIELGFSVDYTKASPDFCVSTPGGYQFNVEAVVSDRPKVLAAKQRLLSEEEFRDHCTIKLMGKLKDKKDIFIGSGGKKFPYSSLDHVRDILSDLHLEFTGFQPPTFAPGSLDLVVLAGDIHKLDKGVRWANETFSCDVLYVLGNHEFYSGHFDRTIVKARAAAQSHVHVLENEKFVAGGIRFLGTTGWTDFSSTGDVSAAMSVARSTMTDYRTIRAGQNYRRLRPDDVAHRNHEAKQWLAAELDKPFSGKTVVVSHHAPIPEVCDSEHEGHLNASYCNAWHAMVDRVDAWIFGHTHHSVDVELSGCRLISNQRGYPNEECGFDPRKIVDFS